MKEVEEEIQKGMQSSLFSADLSWRITAEQVVNEFIHHRLYFSGDDVMAEVEKRGGRTCNGSALGAIMRRAVKDDRIEFDHFSQSKRPSRHRAPVRVWRSKVYKFRAQD